MPSTTCPGRRIPRTPIPQPGRKGLHHEEPEALANPGLLARDAISKWYADVFSALGQAAIETLLRGLDAAGAPASGQRWLSSGLGSGRESAPFSDQVTC